MRSTGSGNGDMPIKARPEKEDSKHLLRSCIELIEKQHVMTLATCSDAGAWSAPVYYLFKHKQFFFFSNPSSRHINDSIGNPEPCSASLFEDQTRVDQIKGVQMEGWIKTAPKSAGTLKIIHDYVSRFSLPVQAENLFDYFETVFHATLYTFNPSRVLYMDNTHGFGNRHEIRL